MVYFNYLFVFLFFLSGCCANSEYPRKRVYHKYVNNIQQNFSRKAEKRFSMNAVGTGSSMDNGVYKLYMDFHMKVEDGLSIEQCRKIYVNVVEDYLNEINAYDELRPYLMSNPFTIENVEVGIAFYKKGYTRPEPPEVAFVFNNDDTVVYSYYDNKRERFSSNDYEEKYMEALRKVKSE